MGRQVKRGSVEKARRQGVCPHDGARCALARRCSLAKHEACALLVQVVYERCGRCKKANEGRCRFVCFRKRGMGGGERGRDESD